MNEFTREELEKIADTDHVQCGDASALARMALAAMDSEPVGEFYEDGPLNWYQISEGDKVPDNRRIPLYRHAQPAQTGVDDDVRNIIGLLETNEWAEHCTETVLGSCLEAEITRLVGSSQPAPVVPDEDPRDAFERTFKMPEHVTRCGTGYAVTAYSAWLAHDFVRMWEGWNACRAAMLQAGNYPVTPDGYVLVPIVPTEDMIINGFESVPDPHFSDEKEWEEYEALSGCRQAARRAELCWAAMIKAAPKQENI
ncbi:hypothetical protein [Citrobacter freundii]|uniref:hypothetical protein n=1 Tax=Citrobacter freundii TaxID=546 RepID=UPI0023AF6B68|nr:hypothetical protein [Citrobacter freundii]